MKFTKPTQEFLDQMLVKYDKNQILTSLTLATPDQYGYSEELPLYHIYLNSKNFIAFYVQPKDNIEFVLSTYISYAIKEYVSETGEFHRYYVEFKEEEAQK